VREFGKIVPCKNRTCPDFRRKAIYANTQCTQRTRYDEQRLRPDTAIPVVAQPRHGVEFMRINHPPVVEHRFVDVHEQYATDDKISHTAGPVQGGNHLEPAFKWNRRLPHPRWRNAY